MSLTEFQADRFGMFIHFGAYSASGRSEWLRSHEEMDVETYQQYIDLFNPQPGCARQWARLAKEAGMKYGVLTAKHHDGFCLFDSRHTDYSTARTIGRDLVAEFVEAFRAEGLKVGLYYSTIDWHHPDYPHYGDLLHPLRRDESLKGASHEVKNYVKFLHDQVCELLSGYGKIDIMWFDFSYNNAPESGLPAMKGPTWEAEELVRKIKELQPGILINNRLGSNGGMMEADPAPYAGDFTSPEQLVPPKGLKNAAGEPIPWESCMTLTSSWSYSRNHHKTAKVLVRALIECISKGGNLLLNAGPNAKGIIPAPSAKVLREMGDWLRDNGEGIFGCGPSSLPKPDWGLLTAKGDKLYAHILEPVIGPVPLVGLEGKVKGAKLLSDGISLSLDRPWNVSKFPKDAFLTLPWTDDLATVVELTMEGGWDQ